MLSGQSFHDRLCNPDDAGATQNMLSHPEGARTETIIARPLIVFDKALLLKSHQDTEQLVTADLEFISQKRSCRAGIFIGKCFQEVKSINNCLHRIFIAFSFHNNPNL